ncbi:MAG: type II toxin-antitoxin system HipA family toxin [Bradymonadaceae bacterium]|nr:type II toxin-antitoxin system HipA family toxin [Lujinxingiaceae bacterium]
MRTLLVEFEGRLVGAAVAEQDDRFSFRYDRAWLEQANAFALSARLPRRQESWSAGEAHPFFANLLPEGIARETVCNRLGISTDNDAALLQALGDDTAGAFRFVSATPGSPAREPRERQLVAASDLERWAQGEPALASNPDYLPRLSLAGAQHKIAVIETSDGYAIPATGEPSTHILKFDAHRFPHLTANEFLTMAFAEQLGLAVARVRLDTRTTPPFLVIERYDRAQGAPGVTRRLHQEDFCQALGVLPSRKYELDGGPTLREVGECLRATSRAPALDALALVRWAIFCVLAGNADGHAKNLSILYGDQGPGLAPFYDLVCTRAFEHLDSRLAFSIGGEHNADRLGREQWHLFARQLAVRPRLIDRELERLLDEAEAKFERAESRLGEVVEYSAALERVKRAVQKRIRAMKNNLRGNR